MSKKDNDYAIMVLEEIRGQNQLLLEAVSGVTQRLDGIEQKIDDLPTRSEFNVVKAAVTDHSRVQQDHDQRIMRLEADAA
jgi:hypothetical protein